MEKADKILEKVSDLTRDNLIPVLQDIQDQLGYLPEEAVIKLSSQLDIPAGKIYGLASFYGQFRFTPRGKYHIRVCDGTTCHMQDSGSLVTQITKIISISDGETTRDGLFSLEVQSCAGGCGQAPVIEINGRYYEKVDKEKIREIINHYRQLEG